MKKVIVARKSKRSATSLRPTLGQRFLDQPDLFEDTHAGVARGDAAERWPFHQMKALFAQPVSGRQKSPR